MGRIVELTPKNTMSFLINPEVRRAPSCFEEKRLWFEGKPDCSVMRFDTDCISALIAEGVGDHLCPTRAENTGFCIVGGVVAAMTGKYPVLPQKLPPFFSHVPEEDTWELLWTAAENTKEKTSASFLASALRNFLPRSHDPLYDRPYYESFFVDHWKTLGYSKTFLEKFATINPEHIERGKAALDRLPPMTAAAITEVAWHIPTMLDALAKRLSHS